MIVDYLDKQWLVFQSRYNEPFELFATGMYIFYRDDLKAAKKIRQKPKNKL